MQEHPYYITEYLALAWELSYKKWNTLLHICGLLQGSIATHILQRKKQRYLRNDLTWLWSVVKPGVVCKGSGFGLCALLTNCRPLFFLLFPVTLTLKWYEYTALFWKKERKKILLYRKYNSQCILFVCSFYSMFIISLMFIHQEVRCSICANYLSYPYVLRQQEVKICPISRDIHS